MYWTLKPRPEHDKHPESKQKQTWRQRWRDLSKKRRAAQQDPERIIATDKSSEFAVLADEGRDPSTQFPPDFLGQKKAPNAPAKNPHDGPVKFSAAKHHVEDRATTIVMTSNNLGDFTKCTIISRIIDEECMVQFSKTAVEIWNAFVHQPQTTRCLVFLLLLGLTCESLAKKYEDIHDVLNNELGLSVSSPQPTGCKIAYFDRQTRVLEDTLRWTDSEKVVIYLKQSLWALKALQFFHDTLTDSLNKISEARNEMLTQINMVSLVVF
jgi:hypothetical protein